MRSIPVFVCVAFLIASYYGTEGTEPLPQENQHALEDHRDVRSPDNLPDHRRMQGPKGQGMVWPHQCYSCVDCPVVGNNTPVKICPFQNSKCVVYSETYTYQEKPIYIRGCVLDRGSCTDIKNVHVEHEGVHLISCYECEGNKCNSSGTTRSLLELHTAFLLLISPLLAKYVFS